MTSDAARRRARRAQSIVDTRGRTFRDHYDPDSIGSLFSEPRATRVASNAAPVPSYVHRFSSDPPSLVAPFALDLEHLSTALDLALVRRRVAWGAQRRKALVRSRSRYLAQWQEFNRLRLDPRTAVCTRRAVRRNVMFAAGLAGRRGLGRRGVRRSVHSQWSC